MFHGTAFLLARTTDKLQFFTLECVADVFLKMNEVNLLQGKQWTVFVTNDKNLRVKIRIL